MEAKDDKQAKDHHGGCCSGTDTENDKEMAHMEHHEGRNEMKIANDGKGTQHNAHGGHSSGHHGGCCGGGLGGGCGIGMWLLIGIAVLIFWYFTK